MDDVFEEVDKYGDLIKIHTQGDNDLKITYTQDTFHTHTLLSKEQHEKLRIFLNLQAKREEEKINNPSLIDFDEKIFRELSNVDTRKLIEFLQETFVKEEKIDLPDGWAIVNEDGSLTMDDIPEWKITDKEKDERINDPLNKIKVLSIMGDILEKMDLAHNPKEAYELKYYYIKSLRDILDNYES